MSEHHDAHDEAGGEPHVHSIKYYVKIWVVLLVLLAISLIGPEFGVQALTLVTAFGIALVKAYLVAKKFMHLDMQPRFVSLLLISSVMFVGLFFAGTSADVLNHKGQHWVNDAAIHHVKVELQKIKDNKASGGHGHADSTHDEKSPAKAAH